MSCYIYQCSTATELEAADHGYVSPRQGTCISGMLDMTCLQSHRIQSTRGTHVMRRTLHHIAIFLDPPLLKE